MAKFVSIYPGPATPTADRTPESDAERMAAFSAWMEKATRRSSTSAARSGRARPFATTARGNRRRPDRLHHRRGRRSRGGQGAHQGLPLLSGSDGKCAVEIFELLSM